jgi:hypothetical protein
VRNPYAEGLWHHFGPQEKYLGSTQEPCGERTKAALARTKADGKKLGNPQLLAGDGRVAAIAHAARSEQSRWRARGLLLFVEQARAAGAVTLREIAQALMARGIPSPSGSLRWHLSTVRHVERMAGVPVQPVKRLAPPLVPNPAERQWWTNTGSAD